MAACESGEEQHRELAASLSDSGASVEDGCPQVEEDDEQNQHQQEEEDDDSAADEDASPGGVRGKHSRNEKKARKAVLRHGLKHVPNICRVILRKNKHLLFTVAKPDVYKSTTSDTYVVFGEAKAEDLNSQAHSAAAQRFTQAPTGMGGLPGFSPVEGGGSSSTALAAGRGAASRLFDGRSPAGVPGGSTSSSHGAAGGHAVTGAVPAGGGGEEVDEAGLSQEDIDLIVSQLGCTRARAAAALRKKNNDLVDAIIELSES